MSYKLSQNPDIILYFEEVRKEHVHKYLLLNKELNKYSISLWRGVHIVKRKWELWNSRVNAKRNSVTNV